MSIDIPEAGGDNSPVVDGVSSQLDEQLLLPDDSDRHPSVSVVLPTLNEKEGIETCITAIRNAFAELGVIGEVIVSDSSSDQTPEIARAMGARVVHPDKQGYGYAYRYGFQFVRGDYVVMGDADTTYDFEELPHLLEPVVRDVADIVLGSRFEGEIKPGAMPPLHQYVGNPLLTKFLNVFYDAGVTDAHSGFRVFRQEVLDKLALRSDGMEFASEMVMAAAANDMRIEEVPIIYHEREGEETLDSLRDGWRHVKFMLTNTPGHLFMIPGAVFTLVGVLVMAASLTGNQFADIVFSSYTMVAGSLLVILGYQAGSLALFSSVAGNPIREPSDRLTAWVHTNMRLEHGATAGLVLFAVGGVAATYMTVRWITSGYTQLPPLAWALVAFTAIIIGIQTVFFSFFLSLIATDGQSELAAPQPEEDETVTVGRQRTNGHPLPRDVEQRGQD